VNTAAKMLAAMRRNPNDWCLAELKTVARQHGVNWRHQTISSCIFVRGDGRTPPVATHQPIKPLHLRKFV
jgi:hypothetical protein